MKRNSKLAIAIVTGALTVLAGTFTADANSPSDCGHACRTAVTSKDYIFHPYQNR